MLKEFLQVHRHEMANEYYFPVFDGQQYSGLFVSAVF